MFYKGFEVKEWVKWYSISPETTLVVKAKCGCPHCEDEVQPGHLACSVSEPTLMHDDNVVRRFRDGRWFWEYVGPALPPDEVMDFAEAKKWLRELSPHEEPLDLADRLRSEHYTPGDVRELLKDLTPSQKEEFHKRSLDLPEVEQLMLIRHGDSIDVAASTVMLRQSNDAQYRLALEIREREGVSSRTNISEYLGF